MTTASSSLNEQFLQNANALHSVIRIKICGQLLLQGACEEERQAISSVGWIVHFAGTIKRHPLLSNSIHCGMQKHRAMLGAVMLLCSLAALVGVTADYHLHTYDIWCYLTAWMGMLEIPLHLQYHEA